MFSSLNNNGYNLFDSFNPNQTTAAATPASFITHVENPSSNQSSPFLPYSAAFLDNGNETMMSQLMFQQQGILNSCCNIYSSSSAANNTTVSKRKDAKKVTSNNRSCDPKKKTKNKSVGASHGGGGATATKKPVVSRRRTGKKDRHSKIYTAQGPRDRRMRLSLPIARKFFDLQDMLGFDKASKTIEWLFFKSKASIKELKESKAASSGGDDENQKSEKEMDETLKGFAKRKPQDLEKSSSTKESGEKARGRTRERMMMEKMRMGSSSSSGLEMINEGTCFDHQETTSNDLEQLGSSGGASQETLEDLGSCSQEKRTPIKIVAEAEQEQEQDQDKEKQEEESSNAYMLDHQMDSVSIIERFLGISDSSSSSIFGYSNNIGDSMGVNSEESYTDLSGNWNIMVNNGANNHQYPIRGNNLTDTTTGNVVQAQNPNVDLDCPDHHQNHNPSFPMAITSSASASIKRPSNEETNPSSSSVSIYDYLSY